MQITVVLSWLAIAMSYLRPKAYVKRYNSNRDQAFSKSLSETPPDNGAKTTRRLIIFDIPNIKNMQWDDGEVVWEFRDQDDSNDNTTSVRVVIPPLDPIDTSTCLLCI